MIRTLVIAAVAFGAASNAWAAKSGCFGPTISAELTCPVTEGYQGLCKTPGAPRIQNAPMGCSSYYICSSNLSACSGEKMYNSGSRPFELNSTGNANNGSIYPTGDRRNVGAPNGMDPPPAGGYGMFGDAYPTKQAAAEADAQMLAQASGAADGARAATAAAAALEAARTQAGGSPDGGTARAQTGGSPDGGTARAQAGGSPDGGTARAQAGGSPEGGGEVVRNTEIQDREDVRDAISAHQRKFEDKDSGPTKYSDSADCRVSAKLDGSMTCAGTRKLMKAHEVTNMVGQIGGTIATQVQGAQAQTSALNAGTQSAAMRGAASTQKGAGNTQLLMGMMNTAMGAIVMKKGMEHEDHAATIESDFADRQGNHLYTYEQNERKWNHNKASKDGGRLAGKAIKDAGIEGVGNAKAAQNTRIYNATQAVRDSETQMKSCAPTDKFCMDRWRRQNREDKLKLEQAIKEADSKVSAAGHALGDHAANEQRKVAEEAKNSAMFAMLQGAQQMAQGIINKKAADQLEEAANKMEATENNPGLVIQPPGQDAFPATDPRTPTVITGNGGGPGDQSPASQDQTAPDSGAAPLGAGLPGPTDGAPAGTAPAPGKYVAGGGGAGAGGGGGGGMSLGGGSTQAPSAEGGDKGPTAANPYVSGTTPISGGGAGNFGGQGGSKEASLNPADMMAAALGLLKPQEKDPNTQAYGNNRGPASQGMGSAFGLPEEDIFKMVEGAIRDRVKAGSVGG